MNYRWVPRWVPYWLAIVAGVGLTVGLAADSTKWGGEHPFLVGLIGNFTVIAISGIATVVVVDRLELRQFFGGELDGRIETIRQTNELLTTIRVVLSVPGKEPVVSAWIKDYELGSDLGLVEINCEQLRYLLSEVQDLELGSQIRRRFGGHDNVLDASCHRLDRVVNDLKRQLDSKAKVLTNMRRMAETLEAIRDWAACAPTKRMRNAVALGAYNSEY